MKLNKTRYSRYIRPLAYFFDILIINIFSNLFLSEGILFNLYISLAWIIISVNSDFYEIYRYTPLHRIIVKIFKQYLFFIIANLVYIALANTIINVNNILGYISIAFGLILLIKFFIYYSLKFYRINFGGNYRNVVIIGDKIDNLVEFFNENQDYGYIVEKTFSSEEAKDINSQTFFGCKIINEIYISIGSFTDKEVDKIVSFADSNLIKVKLLMDRNTVFARNLKTNYFENIPIVSLRTFPLDDINNRIVKRIFDILFSSLVILFILSWLIPIIGIIIKLESKGPIFFAQRRTGLNYGDFMCYKFRSMHVNNVSDTKQVNKGDSRITKIGAILRKTSLDELPQFFNVFLGDMSVVGPRPHMVSQTAEYVKSIDKFMIRHYIKPGITGLAQVSGYRGEVETKKDIIKRVRYDIYYAKTWSILFDIKIIILTVLNAVRGEEKAY